MTYKVECLDCWDRYLSEVIVEKETGTILLETEECPNCGSIRVALIPGKKVDWSDQ